MAIKLNLLPPGAAITGTLGKVLRATKMLGVITLALFLVFTLGISVFFVISTITLKNLNSDLDTLKDQIAAQESTEQQAVLLKDRIGKIKSILTIPNAINNLDNVNSLVINLPTTISLNQLDVDPQNVDLSAQFNSKSDLSAFMKAVSGLSSFSSAVMTSFGFSSTSGYQVGVRLSGG